MTLIRKSTIWTTTKKLYIYQSIPIRRCSWQWTNPRFGVPAAIGPLEAGPWTIKSPRIVRTVLLCVCEGLSERDRQKNVLWRKNNFLQFSMPYIHRLRFYCRLLIARKRVSDVTIIILWRVALLLRGFSWSIQAFLSFRDFSLCLSWNTGRL